MAGDRQNEADVSAMMEALWGPRRGGFAGPDDVAPRRPAVAVSPTGASDNDVPGPDGGALREEIAALRSELSTTVAAVDARLSERIEGLTQEVSEVRAGAAEAVAAVRAELAEVRAGLEVLGERVAGSLGQLEAPTVAAAELAELKADLESRMVEHTRLVLCEAVARIDARAAELAAGVDRPMEASVAMEEFASLRSELRGALSRNMSSAEAELKRRVSVLDATVVDLKLQMSARLDEMAALVATEAAAAAERATLAALEQQPPAPERPRREHRRRPAG